MVLQEICDKEVFTASNSKHKNIGFTASKHAKPNGVPYETILSKYGTERLHLEKLSFPVK